MAYNDWTDEENDLIVADYFRMLAADLAGDPYNKAEANRNLRQHIDRSRGSVELKHQNISVVLASLGEAWIDGYKPRFNFQMPLAEAVNRRLSKSVETLDRSSTDARRSALAEDGALFIASPPTLSNRPPPIELEKALGVAQKFDVAERDELNRRLGRDGESRVLRHEKAILRESGFEKLANDVRWVSEEDGDGAGYDIASFNPDGSPRLIEVKTTNGSWERTPFHISRNELDVAEARQDEWRLIRLWNFRRSPRAFALAPPLERHLSLTPTSFRASFD